MSQTDSDWKGAHAKEAEKAIRHPLVAEVIAELADNLGVTGQALPAYGIAKVANYAAQVARAQALGFDPDLLRLSDDDANAAAPRLARMAVAAGKPTWLIEDGHRVTRMD